MLLLQSALAAASQSRALTDVQIDSLAASHKIVSLEGKPITAKRLDSLRGMFRTFYYDQFRNFADPAAPYFMFMSKEPDFAMGLGGCVRMRGYYDWGGAIPASGFAPILIPMQPDPTRRQQYATTPDGTTLYFRLLGEKKYLGKFQLYIECNFNNGQNHGFNLKKAYATIHDFTVGYASSTFSDPVALPPTVDAQGPNNKLAGTSVLVRYMPTFRKHWTVAVSVETPSKSISVDGVKTANVKDRLPDIAAFLQYQWGESEHVRLSGIVRNLAYRDLIANSNHNLTGWGTQLSAITHPVAQLTIYTTLCYGRGYQSLGGDLLIGAYDLVGIDDRPGRLYAPASIGWCVGVQYNFRPNLFVSATASQNRYLPSHSVEADEYKYGLFGAVNIFWNPWPRLQLGAEFDFGRRKNFSGASRSARRLGALVQVSF